MKIKKCHTIRTVPKSRIKSIGKGKIETPNTQIHGCSLFSLGTGTLIKSGGGLWYQSCETVLVTNTLHYSLEHVISPYKQHD